MRWAPEKVVKGVAYDPPVPGYHVHNLLPLWKAEAAGTASEAKSQVCDLPELLHPAGKHGIVEGMARILW